ncbi:MAG: DUF952 domain-containing protein [Clostridiales bacterium]|nr:DUF952 domain-containing protein [Clostridiales bacterium]MDY3061336.1 DUF952 domain-containing protein [Eubacteriales bacterium]
MKKKTWEERKSKKEWGKRNIEQDGFIHGSTVENIGLVTPQWKTVKDELVIVCIDEEKLHSKV